MTMRTRVAAGLLSTLLSGFGTYELIRNRSSHSINKTEANDSNEKEEEGSTDDNNLGKNNEEGKVETGTLDSKGTSYRQILLSQTPGLKIIDESTSEDTIKNIIVHRMFPHFRKEFVFENNQMFEGSPKITLKGEERSSNNKKLYVLGKNSDEDVKNLRDACKAALDKTQTYVKKGTEEDPQIYRLKAWCAVPTIKDIVRRHKFKIPTQDTEWKQILESEWITNETYQNKQSLITEDNLKKIKDETDDKKKISTLKGICDSTLGKEFTRTNFPATKEFLGGDKKADEFQEAVLLCTVPITAQEYVKNAMKGVTNTTIPDQYKDDYCYEENKSVEDYGKVKTTDPLGGKSFWCAVRIIYHKQEANPSPQTEK